MDKRGGGKRSSMAKKKSVSGAGDAVKKDPGFSDPRVSWVFSIIVDYFRSHTLTKFKSSDANLQRVIGFLDNPSVKALYVVEVDAANLKLSVHPPTESKHLRMLYFARVVEGPVSMEKFSKEVLVGDCSLDPVDQLEQVTQDVFMPLLGNSLNQESWPESVRKEMMENMHGFVSNVQITSGLMRGETFLPLPNVSLLEGVGDEKDTENETEEVKQKDKQEIDEREQTAKKKKMLDMFSAGKPKSLLTASAPVLPPANNLENELLIQKERVHVFEGCLITWTKQIKNVLRMDPESKLKQGLNPLPLEELEFWASKAMNLNSIFEQLQSARVRKVLKFLDASKSTYNQPFAKLCKEAFEARDEANNNMLFLSPLRPWFTRLQTPNDQSIEDLTKLFQPIMHLLLLIWKNSKHYNVISRIVVIMREIANAVIDRCIGYLNGHKLFEMIESEQHTTAYEMIKAILGVIGNFKASYFDYKARANAECPGNQWRVQNNALFMRVDSYLERCHDLLDMTQTIAHFSKLNKIEIGGTKGKTLTTSVHQVAADFENSVQAIKDVSYDVMDVDASYFDDDFYDFRIKSKELERRIASVLTQGFDDCPTITGRFKLLDSFDAILERPIIQDELENKHLSLLLTYGKDLNLVQQEFTQFKDEPVVASNLPPTAGALTWCRGLLDRVSIPMAKLRKLHTSILDREGARDVIKTYTALVANLSEFEKKKISEWEASIEASSISKLKLPLLRRNPETKQLSVNFDPALVHLLREVKYFILLGLKVPENALAIYEKVEEFRRETGNLELIVQKYNKMQTSLLPVERPLVRSHLSKIDKVVNQGLRTLTWKSHGIEAFITEATTTVREADDILCTMKESLSHIDELLEGWAETAMIHRVSKSVPIDEFDINTKRGLAIKYQLITEGGKEIHKLLKDIVKKLKVSAGLPDWKAYVDFVSNIVISGLTQTVCVSLVYLSRELDLEVIQNEGKLPFLEIKLILSSRMVLFSPPLEETSKGNGIRDEVTKWLESIFEIGGLFKRLDTPTGCYVKELVSDPRVMRLVASMHCSLDSTIKLAGELRDEFLEYEYLWTTDLNAMFSKFLETAFEKYEPYSDDEGEEDEGDEDEVGYGENDEDPGLSEEEGDRPFLDKFDERINHFQTLRAKVADLSPSKSIGFLRVDTQPIKQALSTWVTKWVYLFTQYLHDYVIKNLESLDEFVKVVDGGLAFDVESPDFDDNQLMHVMKHIRSVRLKMENTERMFEPLGETMALLRKHGISFDSDEIGDKNVADFYDAAPELWDSTVNKAFKARELIQPRQNMMASKIKSRASTFDRRIKDFRNEFLNKAPFGTSAGVFVTPEAAKDIIVNYTGLLAEYQKEAAELHELENLFELEQSPARELSEIQLELKLLDQVWEMSNAVNLEFDSWKQILWDNINTEHLETEVMRLSSQVKKSLPAAVHSWGVYRALERRASNMTTVIPIVHELHSTAMRERHWKQIMTVTGCNFEKNARFCFQNVLDLNLHNHVDAVLEIVEVANKELKIDQKLKTIENTWVALDLKYVPHKPSNPEFQVISSPEQLIEALEEHQLQLQSLAGLGKFVEFFRERVSNWQKTLGTIESTLLLWLRVQRTWDSLETIFLTGADIRTELPDDTKRFEVLDQTFKELMLGSSQNPNAMFACCTEGRYELLQELWNSLEECQKALNEYLDQKKNVFPRFYFVSNLALLDILSNGYEPVKIMPHMSACFNGIKTLELAPVKNGSEKKKSKGGVLDTALGMVAVDGEHVKFPSKLEITGPVEIWLKTVGEFMQTTLQNETNNALLGTANWDGDRPRHEWLLDFPAQVILLASQVTWTEECCQAIEEVEAGQENALEKFLGTCDLRLTELIRLVQGKLVASDRTKIITLITLDVHGKEVVEGLIRNKVESTRDFAWQSQLRYSWRDDDQSCQISICDYRTMYSFEYIGNVDRLVITPLTDRCYITLTMALRLTLGGAPAGPAGTGKTETTKDLARSLGLPCYVFNCSDQMNYQTIGDIFKGLAQTGAWGCFDEFNRIPIEVLSVVATQVKTILDAIRLLSDPLNRPEPYNKLPSGKPNVKVGNFDFMGTNISLIPTTGFFITMNPGYAGRTELPENLKALFRSCAMIRPDLQPICQNMLMAEGFVNARPLSIKFVTLYRQSSELLSQQPHYDWGLRNVKSVLRVAGKLLRAQPSICENSILMRALRDFNVPKLPVFDLPIFLNLVADLFPNLSIEAEFDEKLKEQATRACRVDSQQGESGNGLGNSKLQTEEMFLNKVVNLQEILDVRHSVMLLGPPGCGKTTIWKTLAAAHNIDEPKLSCVTEVLNPKAITSNELYGFMTLQKDWRDGALSIVMRNMSKLNAPYYGHQKHHWIVLDGDIDAIWIESMNTVMDDNKVLTLVSNERIPLTSKMRLMFEISTLKNATPATVSRAGILYINESDIGWGPVVESWIQGPTHTAFQMSFFPQLFKKYVCGALSIIKQHSLQHIVPREDIAMIQSTCDIFQAMLLPLNPDDAADKEVLESLFVFSVIWGIGGSLASEKGTDNRKKFSKYWLNEFKTVQFDTMDVNGGENATPVGKKVGASADVSGDQERKLLTVFDFVYDVEQRKMIAWASKLEQFVPVADAYFADLVVPTANSIRLNFLLNSLVRMGRPVSFVGSAGTGKTTIVKEYLRGTSDDLSSAMVNMNYYTDSFALQLQLEQHIDKRSGKIYGPVGEKKLIYFVDDLNMPYVEEYGTQSPIALIRQHMDYKQWCDRNDLGLKKEIQDVQFIASMNQKCGSFTINPRLQRHFTVLGCPMPAEGDLRLIYQSMLVSHMDSFEAPVQDICNKCVSAVLELYEVMNAKFLPSAVKFHYYFNMRDISAVFQGLLRSTRENYKIPLSFVRLLLHECNRVFSDRLVSEKDISNFESILIGVSKKYFEEEPDEMFQTPLVFTEFIQGGKPDENGMFDEFGQANEDEGQNILTEGDSFGSLELQQRGTYQCASSIEQIQQCLQVHLEAYNQSKAKMDLVLFALACEHVCRIARIIGNPGGNALLVGVGGSGKQSLSRLSASICGYDVIQIVVTSDYSLADFKETLRNMYRRAGLRPQNPVVLLLTDSQIIDERFLVYINDVLSSGYIPDIFTQDEYDGLFSSLRSEAKSAGIPNSRPHMMEFFTSRVRRALHIILCHSPIGDAFRIRARKFPGLINCTSIDWFHPWPREALVTVASRFLSGTNFGSPDIAENVMHHIAEVHLSVTEMSEKYRQVSKRHNYVTPKSFLELVTFYKHLLASKRENELGNLERLKAGLTTLKRTSKDVSDLQDDLKETMVRVEERKEATEELLEKMGNQRGEAQAQQEIASKERIRAESFAKQAEEIEADAEIELAQAQPAMEQAAEAVNCLTKSSLTELKSLTKPPSGVDKVTTCVLMMIKNEKKNFSWDNAKRMMSNIDKFKHSLESYDAKNIPDDLISRITPIVNDVDFTFEKLSKKSSAAANMANWVINIVTYNSIYKKVKPLIDKLDEARICKEEAMADLSRVEAQLTDAEDRLNELQESFMHATREKTKVEAEAAVCSDRLKLAERLVNGLGSENDRWEKEVDSMQHKMNTLVGDTLLASAFVSYIGAFDAEIRANLWSDLWTNDILSREIPLSDGVAPLCMLADDATIAQWGMEGLPTDPFSIENGALISTCARWPLIIDPQLQGITWLRSHFSTPPPFVRSGTQNSIDSEAKVFVDDASAIDDTGAKGVKKGLKRTGTTKQLQAPNVNKVKGNRRVTSKASTKDTTQEEEARRTLTVLQFSQKSWLNNLIKAIESGDTVIIENVEETFDSVLEPLLTRSLYFKGRQPFLELGGQEVEYDQNFKLILQTRMSNPHYKPETLAQCTLINFIVTESGLEDQLLAKVVSFEKAQLERQKQELQNAFNRYKIQLLELENTLLEKLSNAPIDILSDVPLIESLEATKATANDVEIAVEQGKETEKGINEAREVYREVAVEASMLYFLLLQLGQINHMYQYSLDSFMRFFEKSIHGAVSFAKFSPDDEEKGIDEARRRVNALIASQRLTIFTWVSRGLFVRHKQVFMIQTTFNLLRKSIIELKYPDDRFDAEALNFLLRAPQNFDLENDIDWLPDHNWQVVCALAEQEGFENLPTDMIDSSPRFKEWYNHVTPEHEKLPLEWRELEKRPFQKIMVVRALRPDRTLAALNHFCRTTLEDGHRFADCDGSLNSYQVLAQSFEDSRPEIPIYFILSPGSDVVADVDKLAKREGMIQGVNYHNISLGQGQDIVAAEILENAHRQGMWVFLNNVHLMPSWLHSLSKQLDEFAASGSSHSNFRIFLSSDPSPQIPVSILDRCIKLTNEPPAGLRANLMRSWCQFVPEEVDNFDSNSRSILFGLCYFHSVMIERKTYLTKGFNLMYPFSGQDLSACSIVLKNYMENHSGAQMPWQDLRYLFGEIMYGGHIVNDFDRRVCNTYLEYYMNDKLLDELEMFPFTSGISTGGGGGNDDDNEGGKANRAATFRCCPMATHEKYIDHIDESLPEDTPLAYGLHPNAELGFRTAMNNELFKILQGLQHADDEEEGDGLSAQHVAEAMLQDMLETYREVVFDVDEIASLFEEPDPFQNMYIQECKRMSALLTEMVRSLSELELGFKGDLTMSDSMETLMGSLFRDEVPAAWVKISYPTRRPLGSWLCNLQERISQLQDWLLDPITTKRCTWISGFFNPNAFLTAILQTNARATGVELDKLVIATDVLKRRETDVEEPSRDGAYITGLSVEGAHWDFNAVCLDDAVPKETICPLPVINCRAVVQKDAETLNTYVCPVYRTQSRAHTYVFSANLKTKALPAKWTLAGVVMLMDPH